MANVNAPYGFRNFGHRDGSPPTMGLQKYTLNSSDTNLYFTGDPVGFTGGTIAPYNGSSGSVPIEGIFAGCEFFSPTVGRQVWSPFFPGSVGSSSPCNAYLITDPEMQFVVQASSLQVGSSQIGQNVNVLTSVSSLGNQTTGISAATIASTQVSNSSSFPFVIVDLYSNFAPPGGAGSNGLDNTTPFNTVVVAPNLWARHAGVASS